MIPQWLLIRVDPNLPQCSAAEKQFKALTLLFLPKKSLFLDPEGPFGLNLGLSLLKSSSQEILDPFLVFFCLRISFY